jgi:glycosyltransferase involved in cell wall biosynthesis
MKELTFTLIVATRERTQELKRLLDSLARQTHRAFDVLVIDQNADDRLVPILGAYKSQLAIDHVRTAARGLSSARNVGLQICQGEAIAFPDDDCWYAPNLLERVAAMLRQHPEWAAVTGREASSEEPTESPRFDKEAGAVNKGNIWRRHISFTAFLRRSALQGLLYDTTLGVGAETMWGSGEETDFLLRFLSKGNHVQYEPSLAVFHPDWGQGPYTMAAIGKARRYGMGMGRIMQHHQFPPRMVARSFLRPLLGGGYTLLVGKPGKALYHWAIFVGRTSGWLISFLSGLLHGPRRLPQIDAQVTLR